MSSRARPTATRSGSTSIPWATHSASAGTDSPKPREAPWVRRDRPVNTADDWLHVDLGIGMLGLGLVAARQAKNRVDLH